MRQASLIVSEALLAVSGQVVRRSSHHVLGVVSGESTREVVEWAMDMCGKATAGAVRILIDGSGARSRAWEAAMDFAGQAVRYSSHYSLALASGEASISLKENFLDACSSMLRATTAAIAIGQGAKLSATEFIFGTTSSVAASAVKLLLELAPASPLASPRVSPRVKYGGVDAIETSSSRRGDASGNDAPPSDF